MSLVFQAMPGWWSGIMDRVDAGFPAPLTALVLLLWLAPAAAAAQQTGSITGQVRNAATNTPVADAQLIVVGTNHGALTRADGRFLIAGVPPGPQRVRVKIIGYTSEERAVTVASGEPTSMEFLLRESAVALDEVVVTGVGTASRQREIGNSLARIDVSKLTAKPVTNIEGLLRARVPGVTGLSVTGQVGGSGTLQLRGVNSVSQGNAPLVYVDGVRLSTRRIPPANLEDSRGPRVSGMALNEINPADIDRIEIIKGAAATTLYGTEASGGVIQIFTKRGVSGKPLWSFATTQGTNFWPTLSSTIQQNPTSLDIDGIKETGYVQRYNLSVRGGSDDLRYYLSGNGSDEKGIVDTQWSRDWGISGNFNFALADNLQVQWTSSYSKRRTRYVPDSNNRYGYLLNVMRYGKGYNPGSHDSDWVLETELLGETNNFISGLKFDHVLSGEIKNSLSFGFNHIEVNNSGLLPYGFFLYPTGSLGVQRWRDRTLTAEYIGTWEHALADAVQSSFTWGGQLVDQSRLSLNASGLDFPGPGDFTISSAARRGSSQSRIREVNAGFFFQEKVGLWDQFFLIGGVRVDGNSAFGKDLGLQVYPKLSASYVVSDHAWWPAEWWSSMRLRAAVGESGKAPGAFDAVQTWTPIAGMEGQPGVTPGNVGNPDLGPERTREYELGFDSDMFNSRLGLQFTYYNATTRDALFPVLPIPTLGFSSSQVRNVGELNSSGIELATNVVILQTEPLVWAAGVNLTTNQSKVVDMGAAAPISFGYQHEVREGYAAPSIFGRRVTNPNELADPIFEDGAFLGQAFPSTTIGLNTNLTFLDSWTVGAVAELSRGGHLLNATGYLDAVRSVWPGCTTIQTAAETPEGLATLTAAERAHCLSDFTGYDQWVESGDFFKIREITLGYRLPRSILPAAIASATLNVTGYNLFRFTDYTGLDPEVIEGGPSGTEDFRRIDYYSMPPRRAILTKLSLTF